MPAESHAWTIGDTGHSNAPNSGNPHKPGQEIEFQLSLENKGRQDIPWEYDFHKTSDVNPAPERVEVGDSIPGEFGCPAPFHGGVGQPIDFNAVAPEEVIDRQLKDRSLDLDGAGAPEASDISAAFGG